MLAIIRPHLAQFVRYLISGGTGAALQLGSLQYMLWAWGKEAYFSATVISNAIGLVSVFVGHKFFAFKKKQETAKQAMRFSMLQFVNYFAQLGMVYVFVEYLGIDPFFANILSIGMTVLWNFFIYRLFVYA